MVIVNFTDKDESERWDKYEIEDSGEWVTLWNTSTSRKRIKVPQDRIESIDEYGIEDTAPEEAEVSEFTVDWDQRRELVRSRDNYLCQNCWRKGGHRGPKQLVVHHIVPKEQPEGQHRLTNLVTLCMKCHGAAHRK